MSEHTDKLDHGYYPHYLRIAAELGPRARVCEIGIDQGRGLRMLQALFPWGDIAGVDMNDKASWPEGTTRILARQDAADLAGQVGTRDLIIDDASHVGPVTRVTLDLLWPCVAPGGFYVIEDWWFYWRMPENSMLTMAQGLLPLVGGLAEEGFGRVAEEITYRPGLIVIRKRADQ